jgi:hypothetical protein
LSISIWGLASWGGLRHFPDKAGACQGMAADVAAGARLQ